MSKSRKSKALTIVPGPASYSVATAAAVADSVAGAHALEDYQARLSDQTRRQQKAALTLFTRFLAGAGVQLAGDLYSDIGAWSGVSYGLVESFVRWQLQQGYATGSINVRLATVKAYCEVAAKAGELPAEALALIKAVKGYRQKEARNIDDGRPVKRRPQSKKAEWVSISPAAAVLLKRQTSGKKAARDRLLMCLLLDLGLRCGEIAALNRGDIDLAQGTLSFYRHKVDLTQTHQLTPDAWEAARDYLASLPEQDQAAPLFTGPCSKGRISERTITARVKALGERIGLKNLSAHDCRHCWATDVIRQGTDVKSLQDAGGWSSPAMALKYAERGKIANSGVKKLSY